MGWTRYGLDWIDGSLTIVDGWTDGLIALDRGRSCMVLGTGSLMDGRWMADGWPMDGRWIDRA